MLFLPLQFFLRQSNRNMYANCKITITINPIMIPKMKPKYFLKISLIFNTKNFNCKSVPKTFQGVNKSKLTLIGVATI